MRFFQPIALLLGLALLEAAPSVAQGVVIAPQAAVLDSRQPTMAFTIANQGADAVELEIGTSFGYPVSDSTGHMMLRTIESPTDTMPSAAKWIEAFPARMVIPAGGRRTVRILVTPPANLADGEYWARLIFTSRPSSTIQTAVTSTVRTALSLEVRTVMPLLFRKGAVNTGLTIAGVNTTVEGDSLVVTPSMQRHGNAAWVGTVRVAIADQTGTVKSQQEFPLAVYYGLAVRLPLALPTTKGQYTVRVDATTRRSDLTLAQLIQAPRVDHTVTVSVP